MMPGIPKGLPQVIGPEDDIWTFDAFFVELNITKLESKCQNGYTFGQVFAKARNGSKMFGNGAVEHFYLDKRALEDLIEFYDIEFDVVRGYGFNQGFNKKIRRFIELLFNLRKEYKAQKNPLQATIKLLMNSIYGKSIMRDILTKTIIRHKCDKEKYIIQQYNFIEEITESKSSDRVFFKVLKTIEKSFTLPQFGATVLSWSKHIMNSVMCLAEQNNIPIFYQDTDSMHLFDKDVPKLGKLFKAKFQRKLIGENLGQFHSDFELEGAKAKPYSIYFIGLGKKAYLDVLEDGKGSSGYHIRMKGVPEKALRMACQNEVLELYERMAWDSEQVSFDLTVLPCFVRTKDYTICNREHFSRKLQFTGPVRHWLESPTDSSLGLQLGL
jgi:hypothetical protein